MNAGLSHLDASTRRLVFAATDRMRAQALRAVQPANRAVESRDQIRDQVMAERGVDRVTLLKLTPQARIEAEISVTTETALRARDARIRTTGNFVDLKV